jgi:hypothetical protein
LSDFPVSRRHRAVGDPTAAQKRYRYRRQYRSSKFKPAPRPVNLVQRGGRFLPLKLHAFLDFAAPRLKVAPPDGSAP